MNKSYKILIAFVLVLGLWVGLNGLGPANPHTANAQDPPLEEILEGVLEEVREEIKQDIKTDVRRETSEVVAEERVSPSDTFSGVYVGILDEGETEICNVTITQTSLTGRCTNPFDRLTFTSTSGDLATFFNFNYLNVETDSPAICTGTGTATLVSGTGEPGTTFKVTLSISTPSTCIGAPEVIFYVKQ